MFKKLVTILILLTVFTITAEEFVVTDIIIENLKRTKDKTILEIIEIEKGSIISEDSVEEIEQKLLAAGIFTNDITVEIDNIIENEAILKISAIDKWTMIPIPFGYVSNTGWLAGLIFLESNFSGLNQTLVSGFFANPDSMLGFLSWSDPTFLDSDRSFSVGGSFYNGEKEFTNITGDKLNGYDELSYALNIGTGSNLPLDIEWKIRSGFESVTIDDDASELFWKNALTLTWNNLYYEEYFTNGWDFNLSPTLYLSINEDITPQVELDIIRKFTPLDRLSLTMSSHSGYSTGVDYHQLTPGGTEGSRILPSGDIATNGYTSGAFIVEPAIYSNKTIVATTPLYYEAGLYNSLEDEITTWHGPGSGFRIYIKKVAIPALGADFTWDFVNEIYNISVTLGASM